MTVVDTEQARRESADLGEVLARTQGVGVRRAGGLGSNTRFSLNGLTDDQVRFFLDGVPLRLMGYPFGVANVPVNLVDRIEIFSGVVPARFGADALGGAVNLVTDQSVAGTHAGASYQTGSFDTHRLTLSGRHLQTPSGFFARVNGFFDSSRNDYPVTVETENSRGRLAPARIYRFHDAYRARGANLELGFVKRPWARRLLLRVFATDYDKEYQHNVVMTAPYGGVRYAETSAGATLRYQNDFAHDLSVDLLVGYAYGRGRFLDVADCVYDWYGRCLRMRDQRGETDVRPHDQRNWDQSGFGRLNATWRPHPEHALQLTVAPTYLSRTGDERLPLDPSETDPLAAERRLLTLVNALEYKVNLFGDRLENILFVKHYVQVLRSEEPVPGTAPRRRDRNSQRYGVGDALRLRLTEWLYAKASYEWATRLPTPEEVFGNNAFVVANLTLKPEASHNGNLGLALNARATPAGDFRGVLNGFIRSAERLIVLLGTDEVQSYQNVFSARSRGVEAAAGWTSLGEYVALDANVTYLDFRNTSNAGFFGRFKGDRIPNRPYLFANGSARLQRRETFADDDELWLFWITRYVASFYRGWESIGNPPFKQRIPDQLVHDAGIGYAVRRGAARISATLELHNVTDAPVFDFFGVQRPGRSAFGKIVLEY